MLQSITTTKKVLHNGIKEVLKSDDFKFVDKTSGGSLVRKFKNDDFWGLSYSIIDCANYHSLYCLQFSIRIGVLENLLTNFIPRFSNNFPDTKLWCIYFEEWSFSGWSEKEQERFSSIKSMEDIELVLSEFKTLYEEKKKTVFERFHDINAINDWYWEKVEKFPDEWPKKFIALVISQTVFRHLGISKLAKDPKYDDLVNIYKNKVQNLDDEAFQETLNDFTIYLSTQDLPQWQRPW